MIVGTTIKNPANLRPFLDGRTEPLFPSVQYTFDRISSEFPIDTRIAPPQHHVTHPHPTTFLVKDRADKDIGFYNRIDLTLDQFFGDTELMRFVGKAVELEIFGADTFVTNVHTAYNNPDNIQKIVFHLNAFSRNCDSLKRRFSHLDESVKSRKTYSISYSSRDCIEWDRLEIGLSDPSELNENELEALVFAKKMIILAASDIIWLNHNSTKLHTETLLLEAHETEDYDQIYQSVESHPRFPQLASNVFTVLRYKNNKQRFLQEKYLGALRTGTPHLPKIAMENVVKMPFDVYKFVMRNISELQHETFELGACIDTCHGLCSISPEIDLRRNTGQTVRGVRVPKYSAEIAFLAIVDFVEELATMNKLFVIHFNDTKEKIHSGTDRHAWLISTQQAHDTGVYNKKFKAYGHLFHLIESKNYHDIKRLLELCRDNDLTIVMEPPMGRRDKSDSSVKPVTAQQHLVLFEIITETLSSLD